jgi:site-specific recombinase XerC
LRVFKRSAKRPTPQQVLLPETLRVKLRKFLDWKRKEGQNVAPNAPLFVGRSGKRLSTRQVRHVFGVWQTRAGFERHYTFHSLRHAACCFVYRRTKDILLTQSFARHADPKTTQKYAHPDERDLIRAVQELPC